jgi:hypothetical protein
LHLIANEFKIQPKQIRDWKRWFTSENYLSLTSAQRNALDKKHTFSPSRPVSDERLHQVVVDYVKFNRELDLAVNHRMIICNIILEFPELNGKTYISLWKRVERILQKEHIVRRIPTHVAQNTRHEAAVIDDWLNYVNSIVPRYNTACIVNMDETNVPYDNPLRTTLATRGSKSVQVKVTGSSNRTTALLAGTMAGGKLPPFLVFKAKETGRVRYEFKAQGNSYPQSIEYTVQENAWNDKCVFLEWIEKVWGPFTRSLNGPSLLFLDEFTVHLMGECRAAIQAWGTEVIMIYPSYTSKLQVMDVGVNKPFKDHLRTSFAKFMIETLGNTKPTRQDVSRWVESAWEKITPEVITNSWAHIGIGRQ